MQEILKSIGWKELYPETLSRLKFFENSFRQHFSIEEITDKELERSVALTFAIYGQDMVYEINQKIQKYIAAGGTFNEAFSKFIEAFKILPQKSFQALGPANFIDLFIEFLYSLVIKNYE